MLRVGSGREAEVCLISSDRVLRRYHDRTRSAANEAAVMTWLSGQGYPVPGVFNAVESGVVLERIQGPTLAHLALTGRCPADTAGRVLADLHDLLHQVDASTAPFGKCDSRTSGASVLHMDLHPQNVLLRDADLRRPVVIDWSTATLGAPGLDVARTALILARVALAADEADDERARSFTRRQLEAFVRSVESSPIPHLETATDEFGRNPFLTDREISQLPAACRMVSQVHSERAPRSLAGGAGP